MADENPNPIRAGAANRLQALTGGTLAPSHGIGKPFRQSVKTPKPLVNKQVQGNAVAHMARGGFGRPGTNRALYGVTGSVNAGKRP